MRTTVDIDVSVLEAVKRCARKERKSVGALISELVADALARKESMGAAPPVFTWHTKDMGTFVDIEDKDAVEHALNAP